MPMPEHLIKERRLEKLVIPVTAAEKKLITDFTQSINLDSRADVVRNIMIAMAEEWRDTKPDEPQQ